MYAGEVVSKFQKGTNYSEYGSFERRASSKATVDSWMSKAAIVRWLGRQSGWRESWGSHFLVFCRIDPCWSWKPKIFFSFDLPLPGRQSCYLYVLPISEARGIARKNKTPKSERQKFEGLMQSLTMMRHQEASPVEETPAGLTREREPETAESGAESTSTKISKGLITGIIVFWLIQIYNFIIID